MKHFIWLLFLSFPLIAQSEFETGASLFAARKFPQAKTEFEKYLKKHPAHLQTIEYLGDIDGHEMQWESALSYYKKLITLKPQVANYHYKYGGVLGMIAKESNKFKALSLIAEIRGSFEKAIELDPKHVDARWALIELYIQLPGIVGGSEAKATRYAEQLLTISPVDGHLAKGHISEYFERFESAEKHYKKAIAVGNSKTTYEKLARLYSKKMNSPEKAKAVMADYKRTHNAT